MNVLITGGLGFIGSNLFNFMKILRKSNNNFMNTILSKDIFKTLYAKKQLLNPINDWVIIAA